MAQREPFAHLLALLAWPMAVGLVIEGSGLIAHARDLNRRGGEAAASHLKQRTTFGKTYVLRNIGLALGIASVAALGAVRLDGVPGLAAWVFAAALIVATAFIGRALFYVLVIPTTMPGAFFWHNQGFEDHARATGLARMPQVGVMLGPLGVQIAGDLGLSAAQKGMMVATPVLAGALLRVVAGILVDHLKPKMAGLIGQIRVVAGVGWAQFGGISSFQQVLVLGMFLGMAGAAFAVALPLASRWYPPEHQGTALGIAGAGNSGTGLAALVGPAPSRTISFNDQYGLSPVCPGYFPAACVFAGSMVRPLGGMVADRVGGIRSLSLMYIIAAGFFLLVSFGPPSRG